MSDIPVLAAVSSVAAVLFVAGLSLMFLGRAGDARLDRYPGGRRAARRDALFLAVPGMVFAVAYVLWRFYRSPDNAFWLFSAWGAVALAWACLPPIRRAAKRFKAIKKAIA